MLKEGNNNGGGSSNNWSRVCDTCRSAACILYCRADSAYLCSSWDPRFHAANRVASRHERVWVCEACERAPAAFLRKADAASLCILKVVDEEEDEAEAASWLLPNPMKNSEDDDQRNGFLFGGKVDEHLDLVDCNSCGDDNQFNAVHYDDHQHHQKHNYSTVPQKNYAADSVVPVQCGGEAGAHQMQQQQSQHFQPGLNFDSSKAGLSYNGSVSQSVSISSMDVGVVPESTMSDVSISHSKPAMGTSDLFPLILMPSHLAPMDREARVLRYREKKKTRKFEKKIRYASRKAYAETRPRIKGRFAKRTDVEAEVDQILPITLMTETGYGIVPSF